MRMSEVIKMGESDLCKPQNYLVGRERVADSNDATFGRRAGDRAIMKVCR